MLFIYLKEIAKSFACYLLLATFVSAMFLGIYTYIIGFATLWYIPFVAAGVGVFTHYVLKAAFNRHLETA